MGWRESGCRAASESRTGDFSPPESSKVPGPERITITRAVDAFTAEFEQHLASNTQKKYRLLLATLKAFGGSRGYSMLDLWTPIDVRNAFGMVGYTTDCCQEYGHSKGVLRVLCCQRVASSKSSTAREKPAQPGRRRSAQ